MSLRSIRTLACTLALCSVSSAAHAQSAGDKAAAEALFDQGKKLLKEKNYVEACRKLEESQKLDPGVGTLLYLGECFEQAGKSASAWATFREAAAVAKTASDNKREQLARKRADRLEGKLARLVLEVPEATRVEGLVVKRDGTDIPQALWGAPIPVDPGRHVIEVSAPGKVDYRGEVEVGASANVAFSVPALEDKPEAPKPEAPVEAPPVAPAEPAGPPGQDQGLSTDAGSGQRTLGIVVGVVGLLGIGAGSFFGLQAMSKDSEAEDNCRSSDPTLCSQAGVDLGREADDAATLSTIAFSVGTLALAGGIILYATAPSGGESAARARQQASRFKLRQLRLSPVVSPSASGMFLGGSF